MGLLGQQLQSHQGTIVPPCATPSPRGANGPSGSPKEQGTNQCRASHWPHNICTWLQQIPPTHECNQVLTTHECNQVLTTHECNQVLTTHECNQVLAPTNRKLHCQLPQPRRRLTDGMSCKSGTRWSKEGRNRRETISLGSTNENESYDHHHCAHDEGKTILEARACAPWIKMLTIRKPMMRSACFARCRVLGLCLERVLPPGFVGNVSNYPYHE